MLPLKEKTVYTFISVYFKIKNQHATEKTIREEKQSRLTKNISERRMYSRRIKISLTISCQIGGGQQRNE